MESCKILSEIPIVDKRCSGGYRGITCDGYYFYLTAPDCYKIYKYDRNFENYTSFTVCQPYTYMCFDTQESCFWAVVDKMNDKLYKLDDSFQIIGYVLLEKCRGLTSSITGISYDEERDIILIAFPSFIAGVAKDGSSCSCLIKASSNDYYSSVATAGPCFVAAYNRDSNQIISIYTDTCITLDSFQFNSKYTILDMVLCPDENAENENVLNVLVCKSRSFWILQCKLEYESCLSKCCFDNCCKESGRNKCCSDHRCKECCQNKCCFEHCCKECCRNKCCPEHCCKECCRNKCCPEPCNKEFCKYDIICSIALAEAAISHILNAEGEKIQKAISITNNIEDLLDINKSVNKTIINITHLEQVLYAKLQTVVDDCSEESSKEY